ncbi:cyclophilin-like domain-containing protein [Amylostereum chailletii]|nr:cyclophilin-like domain-containing protein [Amylostereum chailletii]
MVRPRVFMDFTVDGQSSGRVIFELYNEIVPKTCENFRVLCTGEKGVSPISGRPLYYKNSLIHRSIANFMIQGGDFTKRNGTGGESIYGGPFPDENLDQPLDTEGLLCMANKGPDTNGSQFFITLRDCPHLNGRHVVFGKVIRGYDVVQKLAEVPAGEKDRPTLPITIVNCGELELRKPPTAPAADRRGRSASVSRSRSRSRARSISRDRSEERHKRHHSRNRSRTPASSDTDSSHDRKRRKRQHKHKHKRRKDRSNSRPPVEDKVNKVPVADEEPVKETEEEYDARLEREENERLAEAKRLELERLSKLAKKEAEAMNGVRFKGRGRMKYVDPELHQGRWS